MSEITAEELAAIAAQGRCEFCEHLLAIHSTHEGQSGYAYGRECGIPGCACESVVYSWGDDAGLHDAGVRYYIGPNPKPEWRRPRDATPRDPDAMRLYDLTPLRNPVPRR